MKEFVTCVELLAVLKNIFSLSRGITSFDNIIALRQTEVEKSFKHPSMEISEHRHKAMHFMPIFYQSSHEPTN